MDDTRVAEAAAIGLPHDVKGETVHCFVVLKQPSRDLESLRRELLDRIERKMGKALKAERILFVEALPKTRSGKILRGLIRKMALGETVDTSSIDNIQSVDSLKNPF
jgi:acetyl-CoA synthetase